MTYKQLLDRLNKMNSSQLGAQIMIFNGSGEHPYTETLLLRSVALGKNLRRGRPDLKDRIGSDQPVLVSEEGDDGTK